MTYDEAKRDYLYLDAICEVDDLVSVDDECFLLMANPTKTKAKGMYVSCIGLWFDERRLHGNPSMTLEQEIEVSYIAERYGEDWVTS